MIRNNFLKVKGANPLNILQNQVSVQSVRFARKPRWLPTAPSKVFRVPVHVKMPQEENEEWKRLNNNYRTQINSLRRFFIKEVQDKKIQQELHATPADEEAEFQRCLAINESWNQEISKLRTLRVEEENERRREEILRNIEGKKIRDEELKVAIEAQIKKEKEAAATYITRENIDQAIERALANPVSYDFCVDLDGTKKGDSIKEEPKTSDEQPNR